MGTVVCMGMSVSRGVWVRMWAWMCLRVLIWHAGMAVYVGMVAGMAVYVGMVVVMSMIVGVCIER